MKYLNFLSNAKRYFSRYFAREVFAWYRTARYYAVFLPFIIVAVLGAVIYIQPLGPRIADLAIGQVGSSYGVLADKYKAIFSNYGVTLELIKTEGLSEGVHAVYDPNSSVNASFVTAGFTSEKDYPNLMSLGSVQYAPIWLFYRGEKVSIDDPFSYFASRKVGIGLPNTNSNKIFRHLLGANQTNLKAPQGLIELPHIESAAQLKSGQLDALFIVDSYNAPVVQSLLQDENIKIMSFNLADAYVKKFPYLLKMVMPKGSYDLEKVRPSEDIVLLSSTTNLLIEKDTHPAVQWAFLLATNEVGKYSEDFFSSPGTFPKYMDLSFPLSPIAKRFYSQGEPFIFQYLPLSLASLIDDLWVFILAFIALIYPMYKWMTGIRSYPSKKFMYRNFIDLRDLNEDIAKVKSVAEAEALLERLNNLANVNNTQWLSEVEARFFFTQKGIIAPLKKELEEKILAFKEAAKLLT